MDAPTFRNRSGHASSTPARTKSALALALVAVIAVSGLGTLAIAADDKAEAARAELEKLQGTWQAKAGWRNGKPIAEEVIKASTMEIKGDQLIPSTKGHAGHPMTLKLDPTTSPKSLDRAYHVGPLKGLVRLGIYELDGDTLKQAENSFQRPARPRAFGPDDAPGILIWERVKTHSEPLPGGD